MAAALRVEGRTTIDEQGVRRLEMTEQAIQRHWRSGNQTKDARLGDRESRDAESATNFQGIPRTNHTRACTCSTKASHAHDYEAHTYALEHNKRYRRPTLALLMSSVKHTSSRIEIAFLSTKELPSSLGTGRQGVSKDVEAPAPRDFAKGRQRRSSEVVAQPMAIGCDPPFSANDLDRY